MGIKRVAFANNVAALFAWEKALATPKTLGFRITKIDSKTGSRTVLPAHLPFVGENNPDKKGKTTADWPVQGYHWMDLNVTEGTSARYEICPMEGTPGALVAREDLKVVTNQVTFTTDMGGGFHVCFNRGTLSTQYNANMFPKLTNGDFDWAEITKMLQDPGNEFRKWQAGSMPSFILRLTQTALDQGGEVLRSSYEVNDPEIIDGLFQARHLLRQILGNTGVDDATNAPFRKRCHTEAGWLEVNDRMLREGLIPHNKYAVRKNKKKQGVEVQSGGCNLTWTALTCQANDSWIIESDELADQYVQNWEWTKEDGSASGKLYRSRNAKPLPSINMGNGVTVQAHFTPNMPEDSVPKNPTSIPPDLAYEFKLIQAVTDAIYACFFYPGRNSALDEIVKVYQARPDVVVRAVVSAVQAMPRIKTDRRKGVPPPVVFAQAIEKAYADWQKEALKKPDAHAIVHHKWWGSSLAGPTPIVRTKSHNAGPKASYSNDENGVVVIGHKPLGRAYMVRGAELRQHYVFRDVVATGAAKMQGLTPDPSWQTQQRFQGAGMAEVNYWLTAEETVSD